MEYHPALKRREILTRHNIKHEDLTLSEVSQSQKDKCYVILDLEASVGVKHRTGTVMGGGGCYLMETDIGFAR